MEITINYIPAFPIFVSIILSIYVFSKNPSSFSNLSFALAMVSIAVIETGKLFYALQPLSVKSDFWLKVLWSGKIMMAFLWLIFSLVFAREDYNAIVLKWKNILILVFLSSIALISIISIREHSVYPSVANDFPGVAIGRPVYYATIYLTLLFVLIIVNFENTFRNAAAPVKAQIKYSIAGIIGTFSYLIYVSSESLLYSFVSLKILLAGSFIIIVLCFMFFFSIIRYRLLDVHVFISRYVIYRSASILAVGIYLLLAGAFLKLTELVGGDEFQYLKPLIIFGAVLLLLLFLFSDRVRRKSQVFINKNFFANKYDYRLVWTRFTEELGDAVTIEKLMPALAEMIAGIMWVEPVSVWLYDEEEQNYNIAGKFNHNSVTVERIKKDDFNDDIFLEDDIINLKSAKYKLNDISATLSEIISFMKGEIILPLKSKKEILGFIIVGGTITGESLNDEDYDLLRTLSRQSAGIIQSVRLAEKLRVSKQMESITKVTSFVIHDLKNLISSLEILLDNAKKYIDNRDFQKDMIETLENTAKKMTVMMEKISTAPDESVYLFEPFNIIEIVATCVEELKLEHNPRVNLIKDFEAQDNIFVLGDEKAIKKVVSNILINALQALPKNEGKIKISFEKNELTAILKVNDNGMGMNEEFINNSLFKPFRTTKEGGLGIGLYQCRTIIHAHKNAELNVKSSVGEGTTFFVKLPVSE